MGRFVMVRGSLRGRLQTRSLVLAWLALPLASLPAVAAEAERVAVIAVTGSLPDGVGQDGLLADVSPQLHRMVERLDRAATDEAVGGVL